MTLMLLSTLAAIALVTTQGSVQVKDVTVGHGPAAANGDVLTVLYKGMLTNGKEFDSNTDGKKPPFALRLGEGHVIKGWEQGLVGIKEGGKRHLVIPPDLAYGDRAPGDIPPGSTLVFVVELQGIR